MFESVLIANRGEIACRIARTARSLGLRTVAVYSEADAAALHVQLADEALCIGPAPARESYLRVEAIADAVKRSGAQAVHPGYGFLSENADLAEACEAAGAVFVGPSPAALRAMGSKIESKRIMGEAGIPLVPGHHGSQDDDELARAADALGYPVLVKASAGGGGRGMRVVDGREDLAAALEGARRESQAAFGDDSLLLERYLARPRHLEVQVLADARGRVLHLFERDCSLQRRHQKILEEAPAPALSDALRAGMAEAAVTAARAIDYLGAGTVEFIVEDGAFYFMEMNARLQVEHPVTELVTGLDLVEWQLRIAAGEPLPFAQQDVRVAGHAVEARIYAESPARGYLPSTGRLRRFRVPAEGDPLEGIRLDTGVREGDEVSMHYDPLLAKLIAHGRDRTQAMQRLRAALGGCEVVGVDTNIAMLRAAIVHADFSRAPVDTRFAERERAALVGEVAVLRRLALAQIALGIVLRGRGSSHDTDTQAVGDADPQRLVLREKKKTVELAIEREPPDTGRSAAAAGLRVHVDGQEIAVSGSLDADDWLVGTVDGEPFRVRHLDFGDEVAVIEEGATHRFGRDWLRDR